jgi:hypothetical protein
MPRSSKLSRRSGNLLLEPMRRREKSRRAVLLWMLTQQLISPGAGAASSLFISRYLLPPEFINVGISDITDNLILVAPELNVAPANLV